MKYKKWLKKHKHRNKQLNKETELASSEPVTKGQHNNINMDDHERFISQSNNQTSSLQYVIKAYFYDLANKTRLKV